MDGAARWRILRLHVEDGIALTALARETGIGLRTLERVMKINELDTITNDVIEAAASTLVIGTT